MTTHVTCDWCGREVRSDEKAVEILLSHFPQGISARMDTCPDCHTAFEEFLAHFKAERLQALREYEEHLKQVATPRAKR